jgi:hypothetical protein
MMTAQEKNARLRAFTLRQRNLVALVRLMCDG